MTYSGGGMLTAVPYPCDGEGIPVPLDELIAYNLHHKFADGITCLCEYKYGTPRPVRLFEARGGMHTGSVCLGCPDWQADGVDVSGNPAGCRYFVNLKEKFPGDAPWDGLPLQQYPLRQGTYTSPRRLPSMVAFPFSQPAAEGQGGANSQGSNTQHISDPGPSQAALPSSSQAVLPGPSQLALPGPSRAPLPFNKPSPRSILGSSPFMCIDSPSTSSPASGIRPPCSVSPTPMAMQDAAGQVEDNSEDDCYIIPATKEGITVNPN
ncbi:hypothetical protein C8Q77DRAFT_1153113 [Trametes polyzona]|nr:hypothetical protein C8Q77DRAFT_1153113 [Trametes polyzona]